MKNNYFDNSLRCDSIFVISGRGVTVAYMLWEHAVRVQIPAPRRFFKK